MDSFKTYSDAELIELINKHGADNALHIMDLARLANKPDDVVSSGAEVITSALCKHDLTRVEYDILKFWASQLGARKLEFLTTHAHTILNARWDCPSEHDTLFIEDAVSCIKSCVARDDKKLAEWTSEGYAQILSLSHFMWMNQVIVQMELMGKDSQDSSSFDKLGREWWGQRPKTSKTPNSQMRISELEFDKHFLNECIRTCDEYIQAGNQWQAAIDTSGFLAECIHKCDEQIQILKKQ